MLWLFLTGLCVCFSAKLFFSVRGFESEVQKHTEVLRTLTRRLMKLESDNVSMEDDKSPKPALRHSKQGQRKMDFVWKEQAQEERTNIYYICECCGIQASFPNEEHCLKNPKGFYHEWQIVKEGRKYVCAYCGDSSTLPYGGICLEHNGMSHKWVES